MAKTRHEILDGVTLERMLTELVDGLGWKRLARTVTIRCFMFDPTITSSLRFLRKTPWAREQVESLYVTFRQAQSSPRLEFPARD